MNHRAQRRLAIVAWAQELTRTIRQAINAIDRGICSRNSDTSTCLIGDGTDLEERVAEWTVRSKLEQLGMPVFDDERHGVP